MTLLFCMMLDENFKVKCYHFFLNISELNLLIIPDSGHTAGLSRMDIFS